MKVIPLGTGSGKPTIQRSVSGVAVVWESEWVLLDCGEATQVQILRAGLHTSRLRAIFITHLHGDHFNGLAGLLSTMGLDRRERELTIVGPRGICEYLELVARLKTLYLNYPVEVKELDESEFEGKSGDANGQSRRSPLITVFESPNFTVSTAPLNHRIFDLGYRIKERERPGRFDLEKAKSLGIPAGPFYRILQSGNAITLADGRTVQPSEVLGPARPGKSVAYCTDTRPSRNAVELAKGCDLLIHEATFTEDLKAEAWDYGHSTARQAATCAVRAGAAQLLITHISPRYPDASVLLNEAREIFPSTILAEDLKSVEVQGES